MRRQIEVSCQDSLFLTGLGLHWVLSVGFTMTFACHRLGPWYSQGANVQKCHTTSFADWIGVISVARYSLCLITRTSITATNEIVIVTIKNL